MTDVVKPTTQLSAQDFRDVDGLDAAIALLKEAYGEEAVETASQALGDGFALTKNKDRFIGVPLVFMHWTISDGDYTDEETGEPTKFVAARIVTEGGKFIITDGSTGISRQLIQYTEMTGRTFLVAQRGLRKSDYRKIDGARADGTTYYVDTSALD